MEIRGEVFNLLPGWLWKQTAFVSSCFKRTLVPVRIVWYGTLERPTSSSPIKMQSLAVIIRQCCILGNLIGLSVLVSSLLLWYLKEESWKLLNAENPNSRHVPALPHGEFLEWEYVEEANTFLDWKQEREVVWSGWKFYDSTHKGTQLQKISILFQSYSYLRIPSLQCLIPHLWPDHWRQTISRS